MSNVVRLPSPAASVDASGARAALEETTERLQTHPATPEHLVQFYEDDAFLLETIARFLGEGLAVGDSIVIIATPDHRAGVVQRLGDAGIDEALASGRVTLLDARGTLASFMDGDAPSPMRFHALVETLIADARERSASGRVRAYGEMVDLLWGDGHHVAAIRVEELWNDAMHAQPFTLLCAYLMGHFYREGNASRFFEVCRAHSHVLPAETFAPVEDTSARLRETSLQQRARALEAELGERRKLEETLREALRDRLRVEDDLRAAIARERQARAERDANVAFRDVFLGILGHDLRTPLNTILMTARFLTMRDRLSPEATRRMERLIASGVRMQRMIDQLLDMTRARQAGGMPIARGGTQDLAPFVARIVDEARAANPGRVVDLRVEGDCTASVDTDRFEQVVSNLVGNALTYGDPERPVTVTLRADGPALRLDVHNHGAPIDPESIPLLFNPFERGESRRARKSDGLGLGLYISDSIVRAHGGRIDVTSTLAHGTRFAVTLPRA
jgi:signal transduction histidine kinase